MDILSSAALSVGILYMLYKIHQRFPPAKIHTVEGIMVYYRKFQNSCYYGRQYHAHIL